LHRYSRPIPAILLGGGGRMAIEIGPDSAEFTGPALVIEDDALIAMELSDLLEKMGFGPVHVARTREESLARVDATIYAVAVVDIKLDSGDALDAARRLILKGAPFLFASGYDLQLPDDLSGAHFLAKPFSEASFADAIRVALATRSR
jgi:CheY-like chemotaxis protein